MHARSRTLLSAAFSFLLFCIALWAIQQSLGHQDPRDILRSIADLPLKNIGWASVLAVINYLFVAGIDVLAARYAGRPISYPRLFIPSFIGATFQYNAGVFGGTAVRFRLYSSLGFSPREIGKVMVFVLIAFSSGFLVLTGLALLWNPLALPGTARFPWWPELAGVLLLVSTAAYFWLCARGKPLHIFRWHLTFPRLRASVLQVLLAAVDWIVSTGVLYVLLPPAGRASFPLCVVIFMLAHNVGTASNAPGGLGVFEATVLHLLPTASAPTEILASLLAYRGIHFVFPLLVAAVLLGQRELKIRRDHGKPVPTSNWDAIAKGIQKPK